MTDIVCGSLSGMGLLARRGFLGHQIDNHPLGTGPKPRMSRLGVLLMAVMSEVLRHRRMTFSQSEGQALVEMVVGRHAVGDGPRVAQENVTANVGNHRVPRGN